MPSTNFDLAPPAKTVDGLLAVPIDIQRISASLVFDAATQTGTGDATVEFTMGPQNGHPIFDLRQTITAAWLDGVPLPANKLAHHDFGGGPHADLRVVESLLTAGSAHTLRVAYSLGPPQASTAGSYQPAMTWTSGPRLTFNFGFTDLGAGRYLEAWVPANLIFDQFELVLELRVLNTAVAHTIVTNGAVTVLGANQWRVAFPPRFSALSPLVELRASDTLSGASDTMILPVSGATVTVEAWKLASNPMNLTSQITNIKTWLANNEQSTGPYMHGNRFVAFLHLGGMEYEGGTTSGTPALRHETFHSWWARGVKPASQPDAWWDEAWTVYHDNGASESLPFDYSAPPITLCPRNPWIRVTAGGAYTDGYRFWKGVAALIGVNAVKTLMSEFYKQRRHRPATTTDLEEFLLCRTGNVQLVDACHRFVYGFDNPSPAPDLWLRDDTAHTGPDAWVGRFWDSPDLWVRRADDGGTTHQAPEYGQDNWLHARVRNRSAGTTARHFVVTFNVKSFAGIEFTYPADFLPCVAAASGFDLAPGASAILKARWPAALVPAPGTHGCLTAAVLTRGDHPVAAKHVWEHNNLAQKNLTIVDLAPNKWFVLPFVVSNFPKPAVRRYQLELVRPRGHESLEAGLVHRSPVFFKGVPSLDVRSFSFATRPPMSDVIEAVDCLDRPKSGHAEPARLDDMLTSDRPEALAARFEQGAEAFFPAGSTSRIPIAIRSQEQLLFGLRLTVPKDAKRGETLKLDLIQRDGAGKHILGGVAVQINVQ